MPRDICLGDRKVRLRWRKRAGMRESRCPRETFTEWLPAVRPRARLTGRLRARIGEAIGDELMPAAAAARRYGVADRTAAAAFTEYADAQLADLGENQDQSRRPGSTSSAAASPAPPRRRPGPLGVVHPPGRTSTPAAPSA